MADDIQLTFNTMLKLSFSLFCILNGFDHSLILTKTIQSSNMIYDIKDDSINNYKFSKVYQCKTRQDKQKKIGRQT